jgi:transcriptional regulator with XRE-family HTH domain
MSKEVTRTPLPGLKKCMEGRQTGYIAEQLGLDPSYLSQLKNCKRGASLKVALHLARYFKTSVESLAEDQTSAPA